MPKLAIIDQALSAGGVERYVHGLIGGMMELSEFSAWDVTLVLPEANTYQLDLDWPDELEAKGIKVIHLKEDLMTKLTVRFSDRVQAGGGRLCGLRGTIKLQRYLLPPLIYWMIGRSRCLEGNLEYFKTRIERIVKRGRFDVVYFSYPYFMDCPDIGAPIVCTPHDFVYKRLEGVFKPHLLELLDRQVPVWLEKSEAIVVSSNFIRDELKDLYPGTEKKATVIRAGIPVAERMPAAEEAEEVRLRMGLPQQFVLCVAGITRHKNQKVVFEALGRLKDKGIDMPLVCVGPNSERLRPEYSGERGGYALETIEAARGFSMEHGRDYFGLGFVDDFELEALYMLATALVAPSLYEAGSFPSIEAMRLGCPVLLSNIPSLKEKYEVLGGNAYLFDPHDPGDLANALSEMLSNPETRAEKARRALEILPEVYSWKKAAGAYLEVFKKAARRHRRRNREAP